MKATTTERRAILVLGPHRSGTSVITRALLCAGVELGGHLLEPNEDNPKGFFENARIVAFNDRLLKHLGGCWDYPGELPTERLRDEGSAPWREEAARILAEEFGESRLIALKDPRLCLLAPFWEAALQASGYHIDRVLVLRHPLECAQSQCVRFAANTSFHFIGASLDEAALLWAGYLASVLGHLRQRSFAVAVFEHFVASPERAAAELLAALRLRADARAIAQFASDFLDPELRHQRADATAAEAGLGELADIYRELCEPPAPNAGVLRDRLRCQLEARRTSPLMLGLFVRARHAAVESTLSLHGLREEIGRLQRQMEAMQQSHQQELADAATRFAAERREVERLMLSLATQTDLLHELQGQADEDPADSERAGFWHWLRLPGAKKEQDS